MSTRLGRFCEKHGEWAANGECRWCEPWAMLVPAPQAVALVADAPVCGWKVPIKCSVAASWEWTKPLQSGRFVYCQEHHDTLIVAHGGTPGWDWKADKIP